MAAGENPKKRRPMLSKKQLYSAETTFVHKLYPQVFTASGPKKKCRVLIAVSHNVAFNLNDMIKDTAGRFIVLVCEMNNVMYTIINL